MVWSGSRHWSLHICNHEFKVPPAAMKRVADAQESLRLQFAEHICKGEMTSEMPRLGTDKTRS
jgi:hypothetical protein